MSARDHENYEKQRRHHSDRHLCFRLNLRNQRNGRGLALFPPDRSHDGISTEAIVWPKGGPRQVWKINVGIGHSALAVAGDRAYTMGNDNETDTVFAIDVATGKIIWKHSYPCNEKVGLRITMGHSRRRRSRRCRL